MGIKIPGVEDLLNVKTIQNPESAKKILMNSIDESVKSTQMELGAKLLNPIKDVPIIGDIAKDLFKKKFGSFDEAQQFSKSIDSLPTPTSWYAQARARRDPLMSFDWDVEMPQIGSFKLPNSYIEEVQISLPKNSDFNVFRSGTYDYYANFSDVGSLTLTAYEDNRLTSTTYFSEWHKLIQNQDDGTFNAPDSYRFNITVFVTSPAGSGREVQTIGKFIAQAVFPTDRQGLQFNSGSSDRQRITVTFSVNNVVYIPIQSTDIGRTGIVGSNASSGGSASKIDQLVSENPFKLITKIPGGQNAIDLAKKTAGILDKSAASVNNTFNKISNIPSVIKF